MNHLGMAYSIKNRTKMAKGGVANCAHGGPAYCNAGCYEDGGMVEEMHPEHDSMQSEDSKKSEMQGMDYEHSMDEPMKDPEDIKMAKGGMFPSKHMAVMIMAPKKMAMGGIAEKAWDEGEEHEPMGKFDASDDEVLPLDHASEADERFGDENSAEDEMFQPKKKDLLSRIMMKMR